MELRQVVRKNVMTTTDVDRPKKPILAPAPDRVGIDANLFDEKLETDGSIAHASFVGQCGGKKTTQRGARIVPDLKPVGV